MKILCLSDTHGRLPELDLEEIDLVLHGGDFTLHAKKDYTGQLIYFENQFCPWLENIERKCPVYFIWGNHETFKEGLSLPSYYNHWTNYHCIHNNWTEVNGLKIAGFSYTPTYGGWGFNLNDDVNGIGRYAEFIKEDADIILSHGPVYGIHDFVDYPYNNHAGSKELLKRVNQIKPKLFISGHLHDDRNYGWIRQGGTVYVGCSLVNENYEFVREPIVVEI